MGGSAPLYNVRGSSTQPFPLMWGFLSVGVLRGAAAVLLCVKKKGKETRPPIKVSSFLFRRHLKWRHRRAPNSKVSSLPLFCIPNKNLPCKVPQNPIS